MATTSYIEPKRTVWYIALVGCPLADKRGGSFDYYDRCAYRNERDAQAIADRKNALYARQEQRKNLPTGKLGRIVVRSVLEPAHYASARSFTF